MSASLVKYTLRIADDSMILSQRLSEWCGHGPAIEEDIALTNLALDLIGQATSLYEYVAEVENVGKSADDYAFLRYERQYTNCLLVEQPNGDYAHSMVRQLLFDCFRVPFYERLMQSTDKQLAAIAEKSLKETKYHFKHGAEWVIRLGDGTEESHQRAQTAVNQLVRYHHELFFMNEVDTELIEKGIAFDLNEIKDTYYDRLNTVLTEATLTLPESEWNMEGGRQGRHTEHLGHLLSEMQYMQRAYPNMQW